MSKGPSAPPEEPSGEMGEASSAAGQQQQQPVRTALPAPYPQLPPTSQVPLAAPAPQAPVNPLYNDPPPSYQAAMAYPAAEALDNASFPKPNYGGASLPPYSPLPPMPNQQFPMPPPPIGATVPPPASVLVSVQAPTGNCAYCRIGNVTGKVFDELLNGTSSSLVLLGVAGSGRLSAVWQRGTMGRRRHSKRDNECVTMEETTSRKNRTRGSERKKKHKKLDSPKKRPQRTGKPVGEQAQRSIRDFVNDVTHIGVPGFRREFQEIRAIIPNFTTVAFSANVTRNRYKDVVCIDSTRAVLTLNVPPETNYIHANWVRMDHLDKVFIATQAPLPTTIADFWRLCFQENVATILALCNVVEGGRMKSTQYWPLEVGRLAQFGCMMVTTKQVTEEDKIITYVVEVMPDGYSNALFITLIHMTDWPDRGVPEFGFSVLKILRKVDKRAPCIIHCSAGIGRTGTAIAIDTIIQRLFSGISVKVKDVVKDIRSKRASSVQTEAQYVFIVSTVLCYIKAKMPAKYQDKVDAFRADVKKAGMV